MKPGDKVVCIDDNWSKCWTDPRPWFTALPERGKVYVVSKTGLANNGEEMLLLVGIANLAGWAGFYPHRFALLSEVKRLATLEVGAL